MKRSRYVALIGMGASALALTACEDPNALIPVKAYANVSECVADGFGKNACEKGYIAAEEGYDKQYPKYADKFDCEANAGEGRCEKDHPNSRSASWRPSMIGFIMAGAGVKPQAVVSNAAARSGRATAAGAALAGNGTATHLRAGAASPPSSSQIAKAHPRTSGSAVARGGFGSTASRVAASSGSRSSGG